MLQHIVPGQAPLKTCKFIKSKYASSSKGFLVFFALFAPLRLIFSEQIFHREGAKSAKKFQVNQFRDFSVVNPFCLN